MVITGSAKRSRVSPSETVVYKRRSYDDDDEDHAHESRALADRDAPRVDPSALARHRGGARAPPRRVSLDDVATHGGNVPEKRPQRGGAPSAAPSAAPSYAPAASPRPSAAPSGAPDIHNDDARRRECEQDDNEPSPVGAYVAPEQDSEPPPRTPKPSSSHGEHATGARRTARQLDRATALGQQIESEAFGALMRSKDEKATLAKDKRAIEAATKKAEKETERDRVQAEKQAERDRAVGVTGSATRRIITKSHVPGVLTPAKAARKAKAAGPEPVHLKGKSPPMPKFSEDHPLPTQYFGCGKITCSYSKQAFRVFTDLSKSNPSDRCSYWQTGGKRAAWDAAIAWINGAGK